jgi:hypothetical protein
LYVDKELPTLKEKTALHSVFSPFPGLIYTPGHIDRVVPDSDHWKNLTLLSSVGCFKVPVRACTSTGAGDAGGSLKRNGQGGSHPGKGNLGKRPREMAVTGMMVMMTPVEVIRTLETLVEVEVEAEAAVLDSTSL